MNRSCSAGCRTIVAHLADRPGALSRVVNLVRKRGINLETLNVERTATSGVSRLTMVVESAHVTLLRAQLERLIDVIDVHIVEPGEADPAPLVSPPLSQADGIAG